jgi:hypothetical protein
MRSIRPLLRSVRLLNRRTGVLQPPSPRVSIFAAPRSSQWRTYVSSRQSEPLKSEAEETKAEENTGRQEQKGEEDSSKKYAREDTAPPPDPNKSPFQVFVDTFKSELAKSRELQETVKALQDESGRIGDSEALRRAKDAYAKARVLPY